MEPKEYRKKVGEIEVSDSTYFKGRLHLLVWVVTGDFWCRNDGNVMIV